MKARPPSPPPEVGALLDRALEILSATGADGGEVYYQDTRESAASVVDQRVESVETKQERGIGLRLFRDGRVGFSFTPDTSPEGMQEAAGRAAAMLPHVDAEPAMAVPSPEWTPFDLANEDPRLATVPMEEKVDMARRIESCARRFSSRVKRVRDSRYADIQGGCWIANSAGIRCGYTLSRAIGTIELVAVDREETQTGVGSGFALGLDQLEPDAIGIEAASRAINKLGGESIPTRRTEVVLDPEVVAGVFGTLATALHADQVLKGKSLFQDRLGQRVAREGVTLLDDGRLPGAMNTAPVDGEGIPTRRTPLIDRGVLSGFLHCHYTARKMGVGRTGNGQRSGYLATPHIGANTLTLKSTGVNRKTLLAMVARGVYVAEVLGLHTIDPVSGDFSLGAAGWEIENGSLIRPVQKMGLAGNVRELLQSIAAVADDVRFFAAGPAGSTVLLEGISISGS